MASRTSTFKLAGEGLDIPSIAERLSVANILEGSVRTAGNRVRVTAQLIDVARDVHLWSETYDGTLDDIFQIQDEITAKITAALRVQFRITSYNVCYTKLLRWQENMRYIFLMGFAMHLT